MQLKHGLVGCRADSKGVPLLDEVSSEAVTQKKVYGTSLISLLFCKVINKMKDIINISDTAVEQENS